ncbi:MAG: type I glyceraldehyde-3-phosphate dehydrogenase [Candidatus Moranbacteria bacterium CG10_big_fil_rev_8_21_14_0_10_35_21]|nr:MAG: type I glyceraldehyde-3-phosphate dehydrogenase [Candidatus Moranbacteria bacterium CG10_big_fil_rev_8_21_14_0_10_35_21]PJA88804.1 MAG: type I glyceraldehyde-3-phosphate dehydrogenase [Candidatus Moranbacteria bacterium CG_4_9_14_3_um_filter_36_9]
MAKLAINGFGRIGRAAFKIALEKNNLEVVAINDLTDAKTLAHLIQYDTVYGKYPKKVSAGEKSINIDGKEYPIFAEPDPTKLPWKELNIDVVLECTGRFIKDGKARAHIEAGAKKVIISAPAKGGDVSTFLLGVNEDKYSNQDVVSNASCTTNCIAPVAQIIHSNFGVEKAMMTTIHSYTADQNIQDGPHKDLRRARAAAQNIVPTTTGAAIATAEVIPELQGLFDGLAVRVPTINGSLSDFTFLLKKDTTVEEINNVLTKTSQEDRYKNILEVTNDPIVSSDIIGNPKSSIVDLSLTKVVGGNLIKIVVWYDNEWGYSNRLVEMVEHIIK